MNLVAQSARQAIEIFGFSVPPRSCVIHFYYSHSERQRFAGFLQDGMAAGEAVVLACTRDGYEAFANAFLALNISGSDPNLVKVEILPDLRASIDAIAGALRQEMAWRQKRGRLLADFDSMICQESIFELEGALSSALDGMEVVGVTQYDGRGFAAPITIEQFRTHALAIVGNALYQENKNYTPPETYYRARAAGAKR